MTASAFDTIAGIGPARRKALLEHFGSLKRVRAATVDEIAAVEGSRRASRASSTTASTRRRPRRRAPARGPRDVAAVAPGAAPGPPPPAGARVAVITGLSGAGRTTAAKVLEDLGWFVIDNLPLALIERVVDLATAPGSSIDRVALVVDVRGRKAFAPDAGDVDLHAGIEAVRVRGVDLRVLFLEAADEALVSRYEAARRAHPLAGPDRILDGVAREQALLGDLRAEADLVVDTTDLNVHELRDRLVDAFGDAGRHSLAVNVVTFGFKNGTPRDLDMQFDVEVPAQPALGRRAAAADGAGCAGARLRARAAGDGSVSHAGVRPVRPARAGVRAGGQALPHDRHRLHRRPSPLGDDRGGPRRPPAYARRRCPGRPPRPEQPVTAQRVVAVGGGHGLARALQALRRLDVAPTAVVTVADDGGSSGRLREDLGIIAPGDLRMALLALARDADLAAVLAHRFAGGQLRGHAVGNLVLVALAELAGGDFVGALDRAGRLLDCAGRVLPSTTAPVHLRARVDGRDVGGQVRVATARGRVERVWLDPADPPACPDAVTAIDRADLVVLGPGSLYTSVIATLLVPAVGAAITATAARVVVVANLLTQPGETELIDAVEHVDALVRHVPGLRVDTLLAHDGPAPHGPGHALGAPAAHPSVRSVATADLVARTPDGRAGAGHDPDRLAVALRPLLAAPAARVDHAV